MQGFKTLQFFYLRIKSIKRPLSCHSPSEYSADLLRKCTKKSRADALDFLFSLQLAYDCLDILLNLIALSISKEILLELLACNSALYKVLIKLRKNVK